MRCCELMRRVSAGPLTIRLWVVSQEEFHEDAEDAADELAMCAATLADEDDEAVFLAYKLSSRLAGIAAVEVLDEHGNGCIVRPAASQEEVTT